MPYFNIKEKALGFIRGVLGVGTAGRPALVPAYIPAGVRSRMPR